MKVCQKCSIEISDRTRKGFCRKCLHNVNCKKLYHSNQNEKERRKQWKLNNKEHIAERQKIRESIDVVFKLKRRLRHRLYCVVKNNLKSGSAVKDLGCSVEELKTYLESLFEPSMTWENYGDWEIDHIKPLSSFDLTNSNHYLIACNYNNLQPLWKQDHFVKSSKDLKENKYERSN